MEFRVDEPHTGILTVLINKLCQPRHTKAWIHKVSVCTIRCSYHQTTILSISSPSCCAAVSCCGWDGFHSSPSFCSSKSPSQCLSRLKWWHSAKKWVSST